MQNNHSFRLALGADHGGFELKETLKKWIQSQYPAVALSDLGTHSLESVDYPTFSVRVCQAILSGNQDLGILICGTGIGVSIQANRFKGIRAALVHNNVTASMARAHNNANVLCLGGRILSIEEAISCVQAWIETPFEQGRHQRRLDLLDKNW